MASIQKITRSKTDSATGKTRRETVYRVFIQPSKGQRRITKTFTKKKLADAFIERIISDKEAAVAYGNSVSRTMTLGTLIKEYQEQMVQRDKSVGSTMKWWINNYGDRLLMEVDRSLVKAALNDLASGSGMRGHGRGLKIKVKPLNRPRSPATVNRYKALLSSVFEYGKDMYDIGRNPCREIKARTEPRGRTRFLSEQERADLLSACQLSEWSKLYLLVSMALTTGARQGELLRLCWNDLDFKKRRAYVGITKNGEPRVLPLTTEMVSELMKFREKSGLIFPSGRKPNKPFEFRKHWNKAVKLAGLENFRFHDLRHSAASILAMSGATLLQIAEVLGHRDTTITKRYSHLCVDHKQELIDKVMSGLMEVQGDVLRR